MKEFSTAILGILLVLPLPSPGQDSPVSPAAPPDVGQLQSQLDQVSKNTELNELVREGLVAQYKEAIRLLNEAEQMGQKEQKYRADLGQGPARIQQLKQSLADLADADGDIRDLGAEPTTQEVEAAMTGERAALETLRGQLAEATATLEKIAARAPEIGKRQITASAELRETESIQARQSGQAGEGTNQAELARLQALGQKLRTEVSLLETEAASSSIRSSIAEAERELLARKVEISEARLDALRERATSLTTNTLQRARSETQRIRDSFPERPDSVDELLDSITKHIDEVERISRQVTAAEADLRYSETEWRRLNQAFEEIRRLAHLSGHENHFGPELLAQLSTLRTNRELQLRESRIASNLMDIRGKKFQFERARASEPKPESLTRLPDSLRTETESLLETRAVLQKELISSYNRLLEAISARLLAEQRIASITREFRTFATQETVLVKTSPTISLDTFRQFATSLWEILRSERLSELRTRIAGISAAYWSASLLLIGGLLALRPACTRLLEKKARMTRRFSKDRYRFTITAIAISLVLALPVPVGLAAMGLALVRQADASSWSLTVGGGLLVVAFMILKFSSIAVLCRPGGVAECHFLWDRDILRRLRKLIFGWVVLYTPCLFVWILVFGGPDTLRMNDVGRVFGILATLSFGAIAGLITHPSRGVAACVHQLVPDSLFGRWRGVWFVLIIALTLSIIAMFCSGYLFAGLIVLQKLVQSLLAAALAFLFYGLLIRWLMIRQRNLAVNQRLAERKAKLEDQQARAEGPVDLAVHEGEGGLPEEPDEAIELAELEDQTRKLMGFLASMFLLWQLVDIWSSFGPVVELVDISLFLGLSLADLAFTGLVVAVVVSTWRNLPGLLEMAFLRRLEIDPGTRTAYTTLAQYTVVAIGGLFLFQSIGVDWSKLNWIAAALGVGLGFGLQEIVANFVCGIILLFERPVRVGDVVTVDGIDGTVSKIRIRATTLTNWDRKDFIVPNKQFVTGTLMNWTLSSGLNRIVVNVGVAYGSDTCRVRDLVNQVLEEHPDVLDDPPPLVTFEGFGDSSLDFVARCYLPSLDRRLSVIHELYTRIYQRLNEEKIEIPFPQRDLHIRSGGESGQP